MASFAQRIKYKQDMPPPGGYAQFDWRRTFPKTWASSKKLFTIWGIGAAISYYAMWANRKRYFRIWVDEHDAKTALEPFIDAERDRMYLRWLRHIRDQENEVMEKVPGWRTGTWYGEPVYYTVGDKWMDPWYPELFSHSRYCEMRHHLRFYDHDEWAGPKFYDEWLPRVMHEWLF